ncbi:MAG: Do family serine endopeptidase [Prevotellaceae bacterium]|jgi:Do/DeqQ family serine protease|nr:Do family serine endopeptidase [Prevotellaceae bacterium]
MMKKKTLLIGLGAFVALIAVGVSSAYFTAWVLEKDKAQVQYVTPINQPQVKLTNLSSDGSPIDFTYAAEQTVNAVVHVKTYTNQSTYYGGSRNQGPSLWDFFFGDPYEFDRRYNEPSQRSQKETPDLIPRGTGSGVIISADGYVVTNNHVIEKAAEIEVTLNNKQKYKATLVGTDPTTDIALLKIEEENLHYLTFGNSDDLRVGEWVLAVGNPFDLTSTVTSGIVSAKSRSLGIISGGAERMGIESFIQTDAAVNRGNSGGALVNTRGELIGINTAIASHTGDFAGLSFAVPSSIVEKVVNDIQEYGEVKRALLGIEMNELNAETVEAYKINTKDYNGVLVVGVVEESAAALAGIKPNDIITAINGFVVRNPSDVQEQISRYRPGDNVNISIVRDGKTKQIEAVLRNKAGNTDLSRSTEELISSLGATFKELTAKDKERIKVKNGVQIVEVKRGKLQEAGVRKGFVITKVNKRTISSIDDLKEVLKNVEGAVLVEGVYPGGSVGAYAINL